MPNTDKTNVHSNRDKPIQLEDKGQEMDTHSGTVQENQDSSTTGQIEGNTSENNDGILDEDSDLTEPEPIKLHDKAYKKINYNFGGQSYDIQISLNNMIGYPNAEKLNENDIEKWDKVEFTVKAKGLRYKTKWPFLEGNLSFIDITNEVNNDSLASRDWPKAFFAVVDGIIAKSDEVLEKIEPIKDKIKEAEKAKDAEKEKISGSLKGLKPSKLDVAKTLYAGRKGGSESALEKTKSIGSKRLGKTAEKLDTYSNATKELIPAFQDAKSNGLESGLETLKTSATGGVLGEIANNGALMAVQAIKDLDSLHSDLNKIATDLSSDWMENLLLSELEGIKVKNTFFGLKIQDPAPHFFSKKSTLELSKTEGEENEIGEKGKDKMKLKSHMNNKSEKIDIESDWDVDNVNRQDFNIKHKTKKGEQELNYSSNEEGKSGGIKSKNKREKKELNYSSNKKGKSGDFKTESIGKGFFGKKEQTKGEFNFTPSEEEGRDVIEFSSESKDKKGRTRIIKADQDGIKYSGFEKKDAMIALNSVDVSEEEGVNVQASFNKSKIDYKMRWGLWLLGNKVPGNKKFEDLPKNIDLQIKAPLEESKWVNLNNLTAEATHLPELNQLIETQLKKLKVETDNTNGTVPIGLFFGGTSLGVPTSSLEAPSTNAERGRVDIKDLISYVLNKGIGGIMSKLGLDETEGE